MSPTAFAVAAHPDDIEFMMAGTLLLLARVGWQTHVMNLANGSCGTATHDRDTIVALRTQEARDAAGVLGATWHGPLVDDIEILYELPALRRLCAVVREVQPTILLLPSPQDYMEDHANTCRLGVSAAFCRGMPNFITDPPSAAVAGDMAVYHALPYGLRDQLRRPIEPDFRVDISSVLEVKRRALGCHRSQRRWLDDSQGIDSYLKAMEDMSAEVGSAAGLHYAEGWRRHSHLGFGPEDFDPLREALAALAR